MLHISWKSEMAGGASLKSMSTRRKPNHRAALDAGSANCLNMWRHLPGARERGR